MFVTGGTLTGCSLPSSVAGRGSPGRTVDPFINKYVIEGKANVVAAVVVLNWLVLCTRGLPNIVYFIVGLYSQLGLEQIFFNQPIKNPYNNFFVLFRGRKHLHHGRLIPGIKCTTVYWYFKL